MTDNPQPADDPRAAEATAILRRAIAQGCRPVWDGTRLADLVGPHLPMIEFTEAMRRLFPEVTPESTPAAEPIPPPPTDPAAEAARQDAKRRRQQIDAWRRGQRKEH